MVLASVLLFFSNTISIFFLKVSEKINKEPNDFPSSTW